jgi:DNA-binding GntR family transcriptional regulator
MVKHDDIMDALKASNSNRLAEILKRHLAHKLEAVSAALERAGE